MDLDKIYEFKPFIVMVALFLSLYNTFTPVTSSFKIVLYISVIAGIVLMFKQDIEPVKQDVKIENKFGWLE